MGRKKKEKIVETGFGDTLKNIFDITGISNIVEKVADTLGIEDCGCSGRQDMLNKLLPYSINKIEENYSQGESRIIQHEDEEIAIFD
jgi:hypothetical protein